MIVVDEREGSRELLEIIPEDLCTSARLDFEVDGRVVACGDVMLVGSGPRGTINVGVEFKSVHDALSSIATGRLGGTQIPRMLKVWDAIFLLIYGECRPSAYNQLQVKRWVRGRQVWQNFMLGRRPVPWSYYEGFLLTAQIQATLQSKPLWVKQVTDIREAAIWLQIVDRWLAKDWNKHRGLQVFDKSRRMVALPQSDPVEMQIAKTAASFPAMDWVRSHAAAKHFDSVGEMMAADAGEWRRVDGIGPVISKGIVSAIKQKKSRIGRT